MSGSVNPGAPLEDSKGHLPSTERVRGELVLIRQSNGATADRIRQVAPQLCELPAVRHEHARLRLAPTDTHVAALQVLACAVNRIVNDEYREIVRVTLNINGPGGTLTARRKSLRAKLSVSEETYMRNEETAYSVLVTILVTTTLSPCDSNRMDGQPVAILLNPDENKFQVRVDGATHEIAADVRNGISIVCATCGRKKGTF